MATISKILVVCRNNQARSIAAGAALRLLYPNSKVITAGFQAQSGLAVSTRTKKVLRDWGVDSFDRFSKSLEEIDLDLESLTILAADEQVAMAVSDWLQKHRVTPESVNLRDVSRFALDESLIPVDPIQLDDATFAYQLALFTLSAVSALSEQEASRIAVLDALILKSSIEADSRLATIGALGSGRIILDTNLQYPDPKFWISHGYKVLLFDARKLNAREVLDALIDSKAPVALVSKYEIDRCARVFLSPRWRDFLCILSNSTKPSILTLAIYPNAMNNSLERTNSRNFSEILGAIHATCALD